MNQGGDTCKRDNEFIFVKVNKKLIVNNSNPSIKGLELVFRSLDLKLWFQGGWENILIVCEPPLNSATGLFIV